jgi:cytochrome P450
MPSEMSRFPPGPAGKVLIGSLLDLQRDILGFISGSIREYGDVVGFRVFGKPFCILGHPDLIEQVLVRDAGQFIKSLDYRKLSAVVGQGLLTSEGEVWRRQRKLAQPLFHNDRVKAYVPIFVRQAQRLVKEWDARSDTDVHADMMRLTLRIVTESLFQTAIDDDVETVADSLTQITGAFLGFPFPYWMPFPRHVRSWRALRRLNGVIVRMIRDRRADQAGRVTGDASHSAESECTSPSVTHSVACQGAPDLLSLLLKARDEEGRPMSDRQLRDELITVFLAGHETTAIALSFALWLIARHPDVEQRLIAEWTAAPGGRDIEASRLSHMDYTRAVLQEAMRLYPPAWFIGRETVTAYEIGGFRVPKGTTFFLCPIALHHDARFFPDPERFNPDRWLGEGPKSPRYAYFPFGAGPRSCIGANFAMWEMTAILPALLRSYRLTPLRDGAIELLPAVTLRPKCGMPMRIERRRPNGGEVASAGLAAVERPA